jgi:hypothetical protein
VATVADGTGIDGTASGEGTTYTPTFDATELSNLTWSNAGGAFTWTFDATLNDPTLTFAANTVTLGGAAATLVLPGGSAASPSLAFTGSLTSGLFSPSSGILGLTAGGTEVVRADSDQMGWFNTTIATGNYISSTVSNTGAGTLATFLRVDDTYDPSSAAAARMIMLDFAGVNDQAGTTLGVGIRSNVSKTSNGTNGNLALWLQGGFNGTSNTSSFANTGVQFVVTNCPASACTGGTVTYTDILGHNTPTGYTGSGGSLDYNSISFDAGDWLGNQDAEAYSFNFGGSGELNLFWVDGTTTNSVGIGEATPTAKLEVDRPNTSSVTTDLMTFLADTSTLTINSGSTVATEYHARFNADTINGVAGGGTETVTTAATVYIDNEPSGSNVTFTNGPYALLVDDGDVRFDGAVEFNSSPSGTVRGGQWTPTTNNIANLASSSAAEGQYIRVGPSVSFSIQLTVDPTATATSTQLELDLPIASNFGATSDAAGACFSPGIAGQGAAVTADAASDELEIRWVSGDITNQELDCTGVYQVI